MLWWLSSWSGPSTTCSTASSHWSCNAKKHSQQTGEWQLRHNCAPTSPGWCLCGLGCLACSGCSAPLLWVLVLALVVGLVVPHGLGFHHLGLLHLPLVPLGSCSCGLGSLGSSCSICCCFFCCLSYLQGVFPVFLPRQEPFHSAPSQGTQLQPLLSLLALILAGAHEPPSLGLFFL